MAARFVHIFLALDRIGFRRSMCSNITWITIQKKMTHGFARNVSTSTIKSSEQFYSTNRRQPINTASASSAKTFKDLSFIFNFASRNRLKGLKRGLLKTCKRLSMIGLILVALIGFTIFGS